MSGLVFLSTMRLSQLSRLWRLALIVAMASGLFVPVGAHAQTADEVKAKIEALDRKLESVASEHHAIQERLADLERQQSSQAAQVEEAKSRHEAATSEVRNWAVMAYKQGGDTYVGALIGADDAGQIMALMRYLERLSAAARGRADVASAAASDLRQQVDELAAVERRERANLAAVRSAEARLAAEQAEQQRILTTIPPPAPPPPSTAGSTTTSTAASAGQSTRRSAQGAHEASSPSDTQPLPPSESGGGEVFQITCYSDSGSTASGKPVGPGVAATDPRVIPLGTSFRIDGLGTYTAWDTGGAVKGNIIDIWNPSESWCRQFGRQRRNVVILG